MESFAGHWTQVQSEHSYLTEVLGEQSIKWVKGKNEECLSGLGLPTDNVLYCKVLSILDCKDKIPSVRKIGKFYYNFWQDADNKRGVWRRTVLDSYSSPQCSWEIVLSLDELCLRESESWVWKGHTLYEPDEEGYEPHITLLSLSRGKFFPFAPVTVCLFYVMLGGSDATVLREFDLETKSFVENNPFHVPEAKSSASWLNENYLLVGTDMHDGTSMTASGYPRTVRLWKRGTPLSESEVVYEGEEKDVSVHASVVWSVSLLYSL